MPLTNSSTPPPLPSSLSPSHLPPHPHSSAQPPQPQKPHTFPLTRTHQRPDIQRLRIHTTPVAHSTSMTRPAKSSKATSSTNLPESYTPSPAKSAWQAKMQARDAVGSIPGVGLSPACFREQADKAGVVDNQTTSMVAMDADDDTCGCFDFEELCRRAKTLRGQYDNEHAEAGIRPLALPRWHTYSAGERVQHSDPISEDGNVQKAVIASTTNTNQPDTASSSASSKGWWDVLKSPFFIVTPISGGSGGSVSQIPSPESPAGAPLPTSSLASKSLPARLPPPVPTRVPVPASVEVDGHNLKLPAFVAVVMEANRLESERRAANGADLQTKTMLPLLRTAADQNALPDSLASSTRKPEVPMRDYFSHRPPLRPALPRGIQTLPARLGRAMAPVVATTASRPRNAIASASFVQAVLDMDAQAKEEKKMRVKRKKMKIFEEEEEDWEFKCCGVDGDDESLADCVVNNKENKIDAQAQSKMSIKTTVEVKRRPTIKELRSGSNGVVAVEGQGDGGSRGRRKLVRWWTRLS